MPYEDDLIVLFIEQLRLFAQRGDPLLDLTRYVVAELLIQVCNFGQ
ncbi:MAG: hypothetical protein AAF581_14785 [Planctomycetota bacterium]